MQTIQMHGQHSALFIDEGFAGNRASEELTKKSRERSAPPVAGGMFHFCSLPKIHVCHDFPCPGEDHYDKLQAGDICSGVTSHEPRRHPRHNHLTSFLHDSQYQWWHCAGNGIQVRWAAVLRLCSMARYKTQPDPYCFRCISLQ